MPVLRALGWDIEDLEDVKLEYRRRPDNPVDYALFLLRSPRLFIEAKSLGPHRRRQVGGPDPGLRDRRRRRWVALTDGDEWRIYNSHATVPVEQKLFRIVRIADRTTTRSDAPTPGEEPLADRMIDDLWNAEFVDRQVREALVGCSVLSPTRRSCAASEPGCQPSARPRSAPAWGVSAQRSTSGGQLRCRSSPRRATAAAPGGLPSRRSARGRRGGRVRLGQLIEPVL